MANDKGQTMSKDYAAEAEAYASMDDYLTRNAEKIAARHEASAKWLAENMPAGSRDSHGNSVETLISALNRGAASYRK